MLLYQIFMILSLKINFFSTCTLNWLRFNHVKLSWMKVFRVDLADVNKCYFYASLSRHLPPFSASSSFLLLSQHFIFRMNQFGYWIPPSEGGTMPLNHVSRGGIILHGWHRYTLRKVKGRKDNGTMRGSKNRKTKNTTDKVVREKQNRLESMEKGINKKSKKIEK